MISMIKFILLSYLILTIVGLIYSAVVWCKFIIPVMKNVRKQNNNMSILLSNSNAIYTNKR